LFTQDGFSFQDFQIFTERTSNVLNELWPKDVLGCLGVPACVKRNSAMK
jgi:hypothetical protein